MSNDERSLNFPNEKNQERRSGPRAAVRHSDFVIFSLPALAGITYRRQAFAKFRLLTFGVFFLLRLARLLLRAGTGSATAGENNNQRRDKKHGGRHLFHRRTRIIKLTSAATSRKVINKQTLKPFRHSELSRGTSGYFGERFRDVSTPLDMTM